MDGMRAASSRAASAGQFLLAGFARPAAGTGDQQHGGECQDEHAGANRDIAQDRRRLIAKV
jgi:hypothetical protein